MKLKLVLITITILLSGIVTSAFSQILPPGFNQVIVAGGISQPTTMAITPDGRFLVASQGGSLRVVKNGTLLTRPFIRLNVDSFSERGLLGVAVDPSFATNNYIYLCYTTTTNTHNRVSRFTASGDTVVPGSEMILLELDSLISGFHGGGHLGFGIDGKLYIAAGENERATQSQNIDSYLGKILRINSDGSVPIDNPFPGPGKRQRVWAYGLRNPFTFAFQPVTGKMFINDVGASTWEEINDASMGGRNFGWPNTEGVTTDTAYDNPFYTYHHGTGLDSGCSITGGTFFNPDTTNYPPSYVGKYYYIDYCGNWINRITTTGTPTWSNFASNIANYSVGIATGPDGNLYFLSRNNEGLYKITYTPNPSPEILTEPISQTISLGQSVTFSATASGTGPLMYQWRFGNTPIAGATSSTYTIPSVAYGDSGAYNVVVTNSFGTTTSDNGILTIVSNQPPVAVIDTPVVNTFYTAGDTIHFSGHATDPEAGSLPDSLFEWVVVFHHDAHVHPGPMAGTGVSSGSFIISNTGETSANVFYRLYLIVHDPDGATDSTFVDVFPRTTTLILNTQPSGLVLTLDGQPFGTPDTVLSVEGMLRTIAAPYSQSVGQTTVFFTHWSNGGNLSQEMPTPVDDSVFTAYYDSVQFQYSVGNDTVVCYFDSLTLHAGASYSSYAWTDGSVREFITLHSSVPDTISVGVTVTDMNGLTGHDTINVIFDICSAVPDLQHQSVDVFPVPSTGELTIGKVSENYFLNVVDVTGKSIINNEFVTANKQKQIILPGGIYYLLIRSSDSKIIFQRKIVIIN